MNSLYTAFNINIKSDIVKLTNNLAIAGSVDGGASNLNLVITGLVIVIIILIAITLFGNNK